MGSAFFNKVDAIQKLEAIRVEKKMDLCYNFWNEIDGIEGYTPAQLAKIDVTGSRLTWCASSHEGSH